MPFQKGNRLAAGHGSPTNRMPRLMTQALVSQLNEVVKHARVLTKVIPGKGGKPKRIEYFDEQTRSNIDHIIAGLIANAIDRDNAAIKEIFDRVDGRVRASEPDEDSKPDITVRFVRGDDEI